VSLRWIFAHTAPRTCDLAEEALELLRVDPTVAVQVQFIEHRGGFAADVVLSPLPLYLLATSFVPHRL
jgi:hypothetical protein